MIATRTFAKLTSASLGVTLLLGACGAGSEPSPMHSKTKGTLSQRSEIPPPAGKPVLTLKGAVSKINGSALALDLATIEEMPTVTATVDEPFLDEKVTFSGVLLEDFMEIVGANPRSEKIAMSALDDYQVELPLSDLNPARVLIATRQEDDRIKIREGGPTRIVFLDQDRLGSNADMWIWSLETMSFE
jgi:hypothetical protein